MPYLAAGLAALRRRWKLVLLVYGVNLAMAWVLGRAVGAWLADKTALTGFGDVLAREFDVVLWFSVLRDSSAFRDAFFAAFFGALVLYAVWKALLGVGLTHALRDGGRPGRGFWDGVGRYGVRGLLLAGLTLISTTVLVGAAVLLSIVVGQLWSSPVGEWWTMIVVGPTLIVMALATADHQHDYARCALVAGGRPVLRAWLKGLLWPLRHPGSILLYGAWFLVATLLVLLAPVLDTALPAATGGGILLLFVLQQLVLLTRSAVTVGWIGSEVAYFEAVEERTAVRLAEERPMAVSVA